MRRASGAAGAAGDTNKASSKATAAAAAHAPANSLLPHSFRVVPRRKLDAVAKHGVGLAYACMWMPAWGDCCIDDPAGVPVGEMRLMPDITGGWATLLP